MKMMKHKVLAGTVDSVIFDFNQLELNWDLQVVSSAITSQGQSEIYYTIIVQILRPKY
jgi:hypothetical protein